MENLTETEILNVLCDYATSKSQKQAVLLDGAWGSGKSHFVKNRLMDALSKLERLKNNEIAPIRISLYGLSSRQEAQNTVWVALLMKFAPDKLPKPFRKLLSLAPAIAVEMAQRNASLLLGKGDLTGLVNVAMEGKQVFLIFDDFERASMNPIELMGVLNNFVENMGYKALLIADERHMFHAARDNDAALAPKLSVALQCPVEAPPDAEEIPQAKGKTGTREAGKADAQEAEKVKENLYKKVNWLFEREDLYKATKEKLIGLTLHYRPNFDDAFANIVGDYITDSDVAAFVTANKAMIRASLAPPHENLRTLIKACSAMETLLSPVLQMKDGKIHAEWYEGEAKQILRQILSETIRQAEGKRLYDWAQDGTRRYRSYHSGNLSDEKMCDYRFVDEFLETRKFDKKRIQKDVERRIDEDFRKPMIERNTALSQLKQWHYLSDEEVAELLNEMWDDLSGATDVSYLPTQLRDILAILMIIQDPTLSGVPADPRGVQKTLPNGKTIDDYVGLMKKYAENLPDRWAVDTSAEGAENMRDLSEALRQSPFRIEAQAAASTYQRYMQSVLEQLDDNRAQYLDEILQLMPSIQNDNFLQYCESNWGVFQQAGKFLSLYGLDTLRDAIQSADGKRTHNLSKAINSVYFGNLSRFISELSFITELSQELDKPEYEKEPDISTDTLVESRSKRIWMNDLRNALRSLKETLENLSK